MIAATDKPTLVISLDKNHFFAGENVTGKVTLLNPGVNIKASLLLLKVRGGEKVFIRGGDSGGSGEALETSTLLKFVQPLADLRSHGTVPHGTFDYNFSFYLPPDLPGSFYGGFDNAPESKNSKTKADFAVYYTLKAYLDQSFSPQVSEKINLIVAKPFREEITSIKKPTERSFRTTRGKIHINTLIEKNVFVPGESFRIKLDVDNSSGRNIDNFYVKLFQGVRLRAGDLTAVVARKLYDEKIDGVSSKTKKEVDIEFRIKEEVQPTTRCKLFEIEYHLEIEGTLPRGKNLRSHPEIKIVMPASTPTHFKGAFHPVWEHKKQHRGLLSEILPSHDRRDSLTGDVSSGEEEGHHHKQHHNEHHHNEHHHNEDVAPGHPVAGGVVGPTKTVTNAGGSTGTTQVHHSGPAGEEVHPDTRNTHTGQGDKGVIGGVFDSVGSLVSGIMPK